MAVAGDRAYAANGWEGLLVLDVSNATNVTRIGGFNIGGYAESIVLSDHFACLATTRDLYVINISNSDSPVLVGSYAAPEGWWIWTQAACGNYVYLVLNIVGFEATGWLQVIDISDPAHPQKVGEYVYPEVGGIAVAGNKICLANGTEGLLILEMQPFIKSIVKEGQNVKLSWEGYGLARLQRATDLINPDWRDVPGSEATNNITLPVEGSNAFFRLARP